MTEVDAPLPPEPHRRLAGAALAAWIMSGSAFAIFLIVVASAVVPVLKEVDGLPGWVPTAVVVSVAVTCVLAAVVVPVVRYRTWRYAVREEEIDLLHGALVRRRTIVPMARVQHVTTQRGLFESLLNIATVQIHTAAKAHAIPGVPDYVAAQLRTEIARHARVADDV